MSISHEPRWRDDGQCPFAGNAKVTVGLWRDPVQSHHQEPPTRLLEGVGKAHAQAPNCENVIMQKRETA